MLSTIFMFTLFHYQLMLWPNIKNTSISKIGKTRRLRRRTPNICKSKLFAIKRTCTCRSCPVEFFMFLCLLFVCLLPPPPTHPPPTPQKKGKK